MSYAREATQKYSPGTRVMNTSSGNNVDISGVLEGALYVVVPNQKTGNIPSNIYNDALDKYGVTFITKDELIQLYSKQT